MISLSFFWMNAIFFVLYCLPNFLISYLISFNDNVSTVILTLKRCQRGLGLSWIESNFCYHLSWLSQARVLPLVVKYLKMFKQFWKYVWGLLNWGNKGKKSWEKLWNKTIKEISNCFHDNCSYFLSVIFPLLNFRMVLVNIQPSFLSVDYHSTYFF